MTNNSDKSTTPRSNASGSPRPEKPDPVAPPRSAQPKVGGDPLPKGSVRPIPPTE